MSWRIVDISEEGRYLHCDRNWLVIECKGAELGRLPLGDVHSVIVHAGFATYSHQVFIKLAEQNIPFVICDSRHMPISCLWPISNHHQQAARLKAQIEASKPQRKRLWQQLIRAKIREQAQSLHLIDKESATALMKMVPNVRSGDPDNMEARAARYYWKRLLGSDFSRDQNQSGLNAHLNYGYIILRSALARSVIAAGLNPALGIAHDNERNNFALVDDFIEPFRPLVDRLVYAHKNHWQDEITPEAKAKLAALITQSIKGPDGHTEVQRVMSLLISSYVKVLGGEAQLLELPEKIEITAAPEFDFG